MSEIARQYTKTLEANRKKSPLRIQKTKLSQLMSTPSDRILFLQRTIGNQAVQRLVKSGALQAKLKIGQPGDKYEQEADRVADAVMQMPEPGVQRQPVEEEEEDLIQTKPLTEQITPLVQRQVEPEEEEEILQTKESSKQSPAVSSNLETNIQSLKTEGTHLPESIRAFFEPRFGHDSIKVKLHTNTRAAELARTEITPLMQRQENLGEEKEEELIQTKIARDVTPEVTPAISSGIQSLQGGGRPLSETERSFFEPRFGADFSNVRVHSDTRAASVARSVNARAFTFGHNVVFGAGEYSPDASSGRKLFAHELTHVLQQCSGEIPKVRKPTDLTQTGQMEMTDTADRSLTAQPERPEITVKISPSMVAASWEDQSSREWQEFQRLVHVLETQGFAFEEWTRDIYGPSGWRIRLPEDLVRQESMDLIPTAEQHYRYVGRDVILDQMWQWMQSARELGIQTEEEQTRPRDLRSSQTRFDQEQQGMLEDLGIPGRFLSAEEKRRVHFALASVLSRYDIDRREWIRNLPLWIAYYNYYSEHPLRIISPSEARTEGWRENVAAKTQGFWPLGKFTILRENALGERYPARTLGALLLHEFVHVRHPGGYAISQIYLEGETYGVEFFFAERSHDMNRMARIIPFYQNPTTVGCTRLQIAEFRRLFLEHYGTLVCLYEVIDNIASPRRECPSLRSLNRDEAYELARDVVVERTTPEHRDTLRAIYQWVSQNSEHFPIRMPL